MSPTWPLQAATKAEGDSGLEGFEVPQIHLQMSCCAAVARAEAEEAEQAGRREGLV